MRPAVSPSPPQPPAVPFTMTFRFNSPSPVQRQEATHPPAPAPAPSRCLAHTGPIQPPPSAHRLAGTRRPFHCLLPVTSGTAGAAQPAPGQAGGSALAGDLPPRGGPCSGRSGAGAAGAGAAGTAARRAARGSPRPALPRRARGIRRRGAGEAEGRKGSRRERRWQREKSGCSPRWLRVGG